ncbi:uncharacterized protein UTRI_01248 [Ustilago trichophora]|uniref:Uncharacterized protein n=1 Tax=Ustilago trichophora TaxID=86804 RepID=A0A5C3DY01_9BASI|nr:uncharacterized protein UTRI_01248 [Ustilago trichophora]
MFQPSSSALQQVGRPDFDTPQDLVLCLALNPSPLLHPMVLIRTIASSCTLPQTLPKDPDVPLPNKLDELQLRGPLLDPASTAAAERAWLKPASAQPF